MRELLLGLRLLMGAGRGSRVRFLLMVAGSAIGVSCLAMVLTIPGILAAQDGRKAAREPDCVTDPYRFACVVPAGGSSQLTRTDPYAGEPLTRVFLDRGEKPVEPPPGLPELPGPGELFVSPRLSEILRREPDLAQILPGEQRGVIGAEGLAHPDELYAYVGVTRDELEGGGNPVGFFGSEFTGSPTVDPSTLDIVRFTQASVVLLPLAVFLSVCARLSAAARTRRLAALRLLGLSRKGTQRVNAAETVAAASLGAVLGLGIYEVANQLVSRLGVPGFKWYPSDGSLSLSTALVCLLGCPTLAWFVGRASARKAAENPLAVRRSAVERAPGKWGLLPLVPGLGIVIGYCVAGATDNAPRETGLSSILMPLAVVLVGIGLVMLLPVFSRTLAQKVARATRSVSLGLAMRRNEVDAGGALRVATGLVILVFAASLVQGVLIELDQVSKNTLPVQEYTIPLKGVTDEKQRAFQRVKGVRAHAVVMGSRDGGDIDHMMPTIRAVVATCDQLRGILTRVDSCVDGRPARLWDPDQLYNEESKPGATFLFDSRGEERRHAMKVEVPRERVRFSGYPGWPIFNSGDVLIPPSALPEGFRPDKATLTLISSSAPQTVRAVLDGIGGVDPTTEVGTPGVVVTSLQQITVVKSLLGIGMVLGLIIGVAAYLVAATDRAVERKPQVTALSLLGARPRTLRAVQVAQVVVPLAVGLALAVVLGKLAESSYLVTGGGAVYWDGAGIPLLLACAVGAVAVAAAGALPLVGRRIDPELIRRD
ncbi:putative ABC transporter integral membrane subunit [Streptomyces scabiei 87.22]|uniref:Putative ABC transporter integral membrane subunit n=1 Tax=Streptomyces scabiei (strain 87.22) TaxID=680198 RepID=C9ZAT9_STRSW|nr:FtsX-like permease family protein [Streptomyces scabiei]MDX2575764.1 FtsX-like permease family protein [Streptomyces scabiei]MDX2652017.1 FtsX-like permease family protein [Streptomyces scabiei]MDX2719543.1 FtsX-like permease family protein [Streptomyces scabiei]MDX2864076.1 FtsX-like permease family protein [Streptomyces scabiei]MDX2882000.1 FtsX-like permease family protein [Streptomyces scabiei]